MAAPKHFSPKKQLKKEAATDPCQELFSAIHSKHWDCSMCALMWFPAKSGALPPQSRRTASHIWLMTWSYKFPKESCLLKELRCEVEVCSCKVMAFTHRPFRGNMRGTQQYPKFQLLLMVLAPFCPWPLALCCPRRPGGGGGLCLQFYLLF